MTKLGRPPLNLPKKVMLGAAVRPELIERIKKLAALEERSVSFWIERELTRIVEQFENAH